MAPWSNHIEVEHQDAFGGTRLRAAVTLFGVSCCALATVFGLGAALSFIQSKTLLDLVAPNGGVSLYTPTAHESMRALFGAGFATALATGMIVLRFRGAVETWLRRITTPLVRFWRTVERIGWRVTTRSGRRRFISVPRFTVVAGGGLSLICLVLIVLPLYTPLLHGRLGDRTGTTLLDIGKNFAKVVQDNTAAAINVALAPEPPDLSAIPTVSLWVPSGRFEKLNRGMLRYGLGGQRKPRINGFAEDANGNLEPVQIRYRGMSAPVRVYGSPTSSSHSSASSGWSL